MFLGIVVSNNENIRHIFKNQNKKKGLQLEGQYIVEEVHGAMLESVVN